MTREIGAILARIHPDATFAAIASLPSDALDLAVDGVGDVVLPLKPKQAQQLIQIARPAPYGKGTRTLVDPNVRDTWSVHASKVRLGPRGTAALSRALDGLAADLGVPLGQTLEPELHDLLIYGPGQYFAPHKDSEKSDDMVASLVVQLPSTYAGGAMIVTHGRETVELDSQRPNIGLLAFYADCVHEVLPVRSGYRVALTYNLMMRGRPMRGAPTPEVIEVVTGALDRYFAAPFPPRWPHDAEADRPDRLVYLLDHEYTQRSLSWDRLKSPDSDRVDLLRAAAEARGHEVALTLVDVHEVWSAEGPLAASWRATQQSRGYLIDTEATFISWVARDGTRRDADERGLNLREVVMTKISGDFPPHTTDYEGYMGNYGNTADRWYHRAALVIWPKAREFVMRARGAPEWGLGEIRGVARAGDLARARELAAAFLPLWERGRDGDLMTALEVAGLLGDPELGARMLKPFGIDALSPGAVPGIVALAARFGAPWIRERFKAWQERRRFGDDRAWVSSLPDLVGPLVRDAGKVGREIAREIVVAKWKSVSSRVDGLAAYSPSTRKDAASDVSSALLALVECALIVDQPALGDEILQLVRSEERANELLPAMLRRAHEQYPIEAFEPMGLWPLVALALERARRVAAEPERETDDWSIAAALGCTCKHCQALSEFLVDGARRTFAWPLSKENRRHVHGALDHGELPVRHETIRSGSPQTLLLTKTPALFARAKKHKSEAQALVVWLESTAAEAPGAEHGRPKRPGRRARIRPA